MTVSQANAWGRSQGSWESAVRPSVSTVLRTASVAALVNVRTAQGRSANAAERTRALVRAMRIAVNTIASLGRVSLGAGSDSLAQAGRTVSPTSGAREAYARLEMVEGAPLRRIAGSGNTVPRRIVVLLRRFVAGRRGQVVARSATCAATHLARADAAQSTAHEFVAWRVG